MKVEVLDPQNSDHNGICQSFLISEVGSFGELLNVLYSYREKYCESSILMTLDDLGQAQYTSGHATISHDLDDTDGYDLSGIDPSAFEHGEHIGYLSTRSEFFIRRENFLRKAKGFGFSDASKRGVSLDDEELSLLEEIHANPIGFISDEILLKVVPVEKSYMAMCAFPNGYFTSDLNPFENYAVAKQLSEKYGYELFGIGASLLGFIRNSPLTESEASLLCVDLAFLYNLNETHASIVSLGNIAKAKEFLFIKYVDYLEI